MNNTRDKFIARSRVLERYNIKDYGVWRIRGEDPNCDMGGSHTSPELGIVEGYLTEVIDYAVDLPGFWQWGSGGSINKIKIQKMDDVKVKLQKSLKIERAKLKTRLLVIDKELAKT